MPEQRTEGTKIDLERLEEHARSLYLHRFVDAIQEARGQYGRYLTLRAGDELAIRAAADGSAEWLERILVVDESGSVQS
jgi:hypothetical protein